MSRDDVLRFLSTLKHELERNFGASKYACSTVMPGGRPVMDTNDQPHKRAVPVRKALKNIGIPKDMMVKTPEEFSRFKDIVGSISYSAAHGGKVLNER